MTVVFTLCSNNYLAHAITLGQSLSTSNPNYLFMIGLVDKRVPQIDYSSIPFKIIEVEKIGIAAFDEMVKRYSIAELNTSVKPYYFQYFFTTQTLADKFIYLDPDILVYRPFTELEEVLESDDIVIVPHFTSPINDDKFQAEEDFLNSGLYNLGFIAVKNTENGVKMINWWAERLQTKAFIDFRRGLFTDQIWINFVPLFFEKVYILYHPGYNMAYWNLHERYLVDGDKVKKGNISFPLVFFHFSGYNPLQPEKLSKYQDRFSFQNRMDIVRLFEEYKLTLIDNDYNTYIQIPCYYVIEKQKFDLTTYESLKKSIPVYKRIIRGIILRFTRLLKINTDYYTH